MKRASQMPEAFAPKDRHRTLAVELGVDLASEFEVFKDHHLSHGSKFMDWDRALNKWLRNAREFRRGSPAGNGNGKAPKAPKPIDYTFTPDELAMREGLRAKTAGAKL